ncbi:rhamnan synthesis F family protein [Rhizobium puerariae]|uniref:Rhamnan synthesis F family protein n=1 Tax=Rhizobium puerariae TaxID=1585791 RepID=A0ABV6ARF0_9HYPH
MVASPNRLCIAFFYDDGGVIDEYFTHLLAEIRNFCSRLVVVINGDIDQRSAYSLAGLTDEIILRENVGYDVGAYKEALAHVGFDALAGFDELILLNHTFFGPLFPLEDMFSDMEERQCDFWGITAHKELRPNPFTGESVLPFHLNSYFIAIRSSILRSDAFQLYWATLPEIHSYTQSIVLHETKFTKHFLDLGYAVSVYIDPSDFSSNYGVFEEVDRAIELKCPIIKRRSLFVDPSLADRLALDVPRALSEIERQDYYDLNLIRKNILRTQQLRVFHTNAATMSILGEGYTKDRTDVSTLKMAVCAHIYYVETVKDLLKYCKNINLKFDFILTTDTVEKKDEILRRISEYQPLICSENIIVRVVEKNIGADTSALLIACRDLFLDDRYDLVCRIHGKKSPQDGGARSSFFKRHLYENLLGSEAYVRDVMSLFANNDHIGMAFPPAIHVYYGTLGHGWFSNLKRAQEIAGKLDLRVTFDDATPVAPYGGMFWFRPSALKKIFAYEWTWEDFESDTMYADGDLPHAIERLYGYVAQDAGYSSEAIATKRQAESNYVRLEYKLQKLLSLMPRADFIDSCEALERWGAAGYPMATARPSLVENTERAKPVARPAAISLLVRARVASEYLKSGNSPSGRFLSRLRRWHRSASKMTVTIDELNGLPNPGGALLSFSHGKLSELVVRGWAVPPGRDSVFATMLLQLEGSDTRLVSECLMTERPDVAAHLRSKQRLRSGFVARIASSEIPRGTFNLRLVGVTVGGRKFVSHSTATIVIS